MKAGDVAQGVESLLSKHEDLHSNPSTESKTKQNKQKDLNELILNFTFSSSC
jgi:hypothetical protein